MKIWQQLSNILSLPPRHAANERLSGASLPKDAALLGRLGCWAVAEGLGRCGKWWRALVEVINQS